MEAGTTQPKPSSPPVTPQPDSNVLIQQRLSSSPVDDSLNTQQSGGEEELSAEELTTEDEKEAEELTAQQSLNLEIEHHRLAAPFGLMESLLAASQQKDYQTKVCQAKLQQTMSKLTEKLPHDDLDENVALAKDILKLASYKNGGVINKLSEKLTKNLKYASHDYESMYNSIAVFAQQVSTELLAKEPTHRNNTVKLLEALLKRLSKITITESGLLYPASYAAVQLLTKMADIEEQGEEFRLTPNQKAGLAGLIFNVIDNLQELKQIEQEKERQEKKKLSKKPKKEENSAKEAKPKPIEDSDAKVIASILTQAHQLLENTTEGQSERTARINTLKNSLSFLLNLTACASSWYGAVQSMGVSAPEAMQKTLETTKQGWSLIGPFVTAARKKIFGLRWYEELAKWQEHWLNQTGEQEQLDFLEELMSNQGTAAYDDKEDKTEMVDVTAHYHDFRFKMGMMQVLEQSTVNWIEKKLFQKEEFQEKFIDILLAFYQEPNKNVPQLIKEEEEKESEKEEERDEATEEQSLEALPRAQIILNHKVAGILRYCIIQHRITLTEEQKQKIFNQRQELAEEILSPKEELQADDEYIAETWFTVFTQDKQVLDIIKKANIDANDCKTIVTIQGKSKQDKATRLSPWGKQLLALAQRRIEQQQEQINSSQSASIATTANLQDSAKLDVNRKVKGGKTTLRGNVDERILKLQNQQKLKQLKLFQQGTGTPYFGNLTATNQAQVTINEEFEAGSSEIFSEKASAAHSKYGFKYAKPETPSEKKKKKDTKVKKEVTTSAEGVSADNDQSKGASNRPN